ncbi:MAG: ABC transporter ATP-binding protein [Ignavibacteriaceae bacterium]|jgi:subfamily B ATP-binding cassette protein MsbA|nr:ABC transporter ATP-binding protein [Ignavibacteriaceae bacterium]
MKTYSRLLRYLKPYKKQISLSMLFTVLFSLLNGASVYLTIPLLDTLFNKKEAVNVVSKNHIPEKLNFISQIFDNIKNFFSDWIFSGTTIDTLMKICILILITFFLKNVSGYLQAYFLAHVEQGVIKDIRNEAYRHLHKLPMSYFKNEKTGNLISRITNDVNVVQTSISAVFLNLIREPLSIVVFLGIAISISWKLTLFSFVILPFSLIIISWIGLKLRKHSGFLQEKMADITTVLHETITGVKIVKAFGMEEYENKKFMEQTRGFFKLSLKMVRIRNTAAPVTEFLSVVVGVLIIFFGAQLVLVENTIKASEFLGFLFAIFQLMPPIKELSSVNNRIQESSAAADRIFEILDTEPRIKNNDDSIGFRDFNGNMEFDNVSFHYDDADKDDTVLNNISFSIKKGEIIALVGSSGSGKTTLVDLIPRFYDPTSGQIKIDGIDIKKIRLEDLRKLMGIVTQETVLFNESIIKNIAYGLEKYPEEEIINAAIAANAHEFILHLPLKYETIIGEKGIKLSGGQRQRISIARALLKNPPIMIFDEATSALDNESEVLVQEAIERLMIDRTTFVIAHRLSTIRNADRILVLDKGRIVQDGKHDQLLEDHSGLYRKLYELQFRD